MRAKWSILTRFQAQSRPAAFGFLVVLVLILSACAGSASGDGRGIDEGDRAVNFTLQALEGSEASLDDYLGSPLLVNFWATWCPPCRDEIPDLEAAYRTYQDQGLVVLGVSVQDKPEIVVPFAEMMDMTYPILLDTNAQAMNTYRLLGLPTTIVIDREGKILARHSGLITPAQIEGYVDDLLP